MDEALAKRILQWWDQYTYTLDNHGHFLFLDAPFFVTMAQEVMQQKDPQHPVDLPISLDIIG